MTDHEAIEMALRQFTAKHGLGATGKHPLGEKFSDDQGGLKAAVVGLKEQGLIVVVFGEPFGWIGMPPQQAVEFAEVLIKRAREISTEPIVVKL
jgi:hypothetical protein